MCSNCNQSTGEKETAFGFQVHSGLDLMEWCCLLQGVYCSKVAVDCILTVIWCFSCCTVLKKDSLGCYKVPFLWRACTVDVQLSFGRSGAIFCISSIPSHYLTTQSTLFFFFSSPCNVSPPPLHPTHPSSFYHLIVVSFLAPIFLLFLKSLEAEVFKSVIAVSVSFTRNFFRLVWIFHSITWQSGVQFMPSASLSHTATFSVHLLSLSLFHNLDCSFSVRPQ